MSLTINDKYRLWLTNPKTWKKICSEEELTIFRERKSKGDLPEDFSDSDDETSVRELKKLKTIEIPDDKEESRESKDLRTGDTPLALKQSQDEFKLNADKGAQEIREPLNGQQAPPWDWPMSRHPIPRQDAIMAAHNNWMANWENDFLVPR